MSHLTQSMVEQFFELEKESARGVLRKEMDSAMDTIFKQMKRKLMQLVDNVELGNETGHGLAHLGDPVHHEQQLYEGFNDFNPIPSTTANSHGHLSNMNVSNISQHYGLGDRVHHEQQLHSNSNQIPSTSTNSRTPDNSNSNQEDQIIVKIELDEFVNIIESIPTSSTLPSNDSIHNSFDELDDEEDEDCDCPECVGDLFVMKEEGDDQEYGDDENSYSVGDLDESNDSISRPSKRPRLENDQLHDQANMQTNQNPVITIRLKCPQCSQMYNDKDALNDHLKSIHSISKFRCMYKECTRSFDKQYQLTRHYSGDHQTQPNTMWPCGYCSGTFKSSHSLLTHYLNLHHEGLFQCAFPDCQFVAELKQTVINHHAANHKGHVCPYPGCAKRFTKANHLRTHQRGHRDAKPYRCKLPQCQFAGSAYKSEAMKHIRNHLKKIEPNTNSTNLYDPNDYLEVVPELL